MLAGQLIAQNLNARAGKFNDPPALPADHVVVRQLPQGKFIMGLLITEMDLLEDSAVHQQRQGSVDGRLAHPQSALP
ncbi:MAG: hypothetical protein HJJLKODD_01526 [Phycisphaerae bacterium]|nr:hypothetical protein [Phycisphaerae bacterium]